MDNNYNIENESAELEVMPKKLPLDKRLKKKKGIWAVLGSLLVVLGKLKSLLVLFKFGKFGVTAISMLFMIWVYAKMYGLAYGIGFVILLFIHEMGHYFMAKQQEVNVSAPVFIPFFGALISMKEQPRDVVSEAKLAVGGPVLGTLGAFMCFILYSMGGQNFFLALAYTGFMLNLFNLIPVHPIDGGRIVGAISPKIWLIGIPILGFFCFKFFNPLLIIFVVLGALEAFKQWKSPDKDYYNVELSTRLTFAVIYFGLIAFLGSGMYFIHGLHSTMFNY